MQFHLVEDASQRFGIRGRLVNILKLPQWEPFNTNIVSLGSTRVVLTQDARSAISLIRRDLPAPGSVISHSTCQERNTAITYLVLSVTHILVCRIVDGVLEYTKPEPFLNGTDPPPDAAISLLIFATLPTYTETLLHRLPGELQDMILDRISLGSIEGARIRCLMGLGSPFTWKSEGKELKREEGCRSRSPYSPVEEQIWFGDHHSGVVYKPDSSTSRNSRR